MSKKKIQKSIESRKRLKEMKRLIREGKDPRSLRGFRK